MDTKPDEFITAVKKHKAELVGMSALLTTTMRNIEKINQAFQEVGLRNKIKTMAGGAALTEDLALKMRCDGYGKDALGCVEKAKELLEILNQSEPVTN